MNSQPVLRLEFERWLGNTFHSGATWDEARNCYTEFPVHAAWQAWRAARSLDSGAVEQVNTRDLAARLLTRYKLDEAVEIIKQLRKALSLSTPPSTAKESLMAGGERDENRLIERRRGERRKDEKELPEIGWRKINSDRRRPSAEPINAGSGRSESLRSQSKDSSTQETVAESSLAPAPASGQAEAMREGAAKIAESLQIPTEWWEGHERAHRVATPADIAAAIRALPMPPESEAERLLREARVYIDFAIDYGAGGRGAELLARIDAYLSAKPAASEPVSKMDDPLYWLIIALLDRQDVRDSDDKQAPNIAMSILTDFDAKFPNVRAYLGAGR